MIPWFKADNQLWAEGTAALVGRWPDALCLLDLDHLLCTRENMPPLRVLARRWGCSWERAANLVRRATMSHLRLSHSELPDANRTQTGRKPDGDRTQTGRKPDGSTGVEAAQLASDRTETGRKPDANRTQTGRRPDANRTGALESDGPAPLSRPLDREEDTEEDTEERIAAAPGKPGRLTGPQWSGMGRLILVSRPVVTVAEPSPDVPPGRVDGQATLDLPPTPGPAVEAPARRKRASPKGPGEPAPSKATQNAAIVRSCTDVWADAWKARFADPYPWLLHSGGEDRRHALAWAASVGASGPLTLDQASRLRAGVNRYLDRAATGKAWPPGPPTTKGFTRGLAEWLQAPAPPRGSYKGPAKPYIDDPDHPDFVSPF